MGVSVVSPVIIGRREEMTALAGALRLAEAHLAAGDRDQAALSVQEAHATADRLGAQPLADEAAALAHRLGVTGPART